MAASSVEEAILFGVLESIAVVLPLSAAMRIWRAPRLAFDCLLPVCIIMSYWTAYNKFPPFPPIGAVNKLPYVLCAGLGLGVICDLVHSKTVGTIVCCVFAATAALYIGWSQLQSGAMAVAFAGLAGSEDTGSRLLKSRSMPQFREHNDPEAGVPALPRTAQR